MAPGTNPMEVGVQAREADVIAPTGKDTSAAQTNRLAAHFLLTNDCRSFAGLSCARLSTVLQIATDAWRGLVK